MLNLTYLALLGNLLLMPLAASCGAESSLLLPLLTKRHSGTHFQMRPLSCVHMQALMQAARLAPSSYNDQPWNFIFCNHFTHPEVHLKACGSIVGQDWVKSAPLLVVVVVRQHFVHNLQANAWAAYDTGAAAISMCLQAADMGVMTHQIGGFDKAQISRDFNLPDGFYPIAIMAIGYEEIAAEKKVRQRRPISENFFNGAWGQPF